MADQTTIDEKLTSDSSTEVAPASEGQTTDVNTQSESSSDASSQEKAKTLEEVAKDIYDKSQSQSDETQKVEEPAEKDAQEESQKKEDGQTQKEGPVPYERFAEVNTKKVELEQQIAQVQPLLESYYSIHNYLQENNITPEEHSNWMGIMAKLKQDPAQALEALKPYLEVMQSHTGEKLDEDLKSAVDGGEISLKYAKELMATRSKAQFVQKQTLQFQQASQAQLQQQHFNRLQQTLNSWVSNKGSLIPEFKPKTDANAPDGVYELFLNKFANEARVANPKSEAELIAIAEKALTGIQSSISRFAPKQSNGSKFVRSSQTNTQAPREPKTLQEVAIAVAKKHGISYTPR
jgi:hypothetical protein